MSNLSIPRIFPLVVSLLPLFVCGSEPMSVPLSSGEGRQTIRVTSRPNAPRAFATDKIFLLRSVFYRCRALPFPLIVCPLWPSKRTRHTPSFERKKNVSTMKTERSYHPQNGFETKRRLLTLPHKNRLDSRLYCGVESHRHFGRIDGHLDAGCRLLSRACNPPNGSSGAVLPYSMALHRRCIGLDR